MKLRCTGIVLVQHDNRGRLRGRLVQYRLFAQNIRVQVVEIRTDSRPRPCCSMWRRSEASGLLTTDSPVASAACGELRAVILRAVETFGVCEMQNADASTLDTPCMSSPSLPAVNTESKPDVTIQ